MLALEGLIAPPLKALGFKKRARTWWRHRDETIQVLNLQKSSFGERLYVNLGVYVKALETEEFPPEQRCHVQVRLERVVPEERSLSVASADSITDPKPELISAVLEDGLGWLDQVATYRGLREYIASGGAGKGMVFANLRELLAAHP